MTSATGSRSALPTPRPAANHAHASVAEPLTCANTPVHAKVTPQDWLTKALRESVGSCNIQDNLKGRERGSWRKGTA